MENSFKRLLKNNEKEDWNNLTFRKTMVNAFMYCAKKHIDIAKEEKNKETKILLKEGKLTKKQVKLIVRKAKKEVFDDVSKSIIENGYLVYAKYLKLKKKHLEG